MGKNRNKNRSHSQPVAPPVTALAHGAPTQSQAAVEPVAAPARPVQVSLELIRIKAALPLVLGVAEDRKSEFRSAAEEAPFLLRSLGLGAGISTFAAKEGQRAAFAEMLAKWLMRDCMHSPFRTATGPCDATVLLTKLAASGRNDYRAAQIEAVGFATSLKRLAQALCPKEGEA